VLHILLRWDLVVKVDDLEDDINRLEEELYELKEKK